MYSYELCKYRETCMNIEREYIKSIFTGNSYFLRGIKNLFALALTFFSPSFRTVEKFLHFSGTFSKLFLQSSKILNKHILTKKFAVARFLQRIVKKLK